MVTTEKEMVRKLAEAAPPADRATSLQATYEDTVPPNPDDDWEFEQD